MASVPDHFFEQSAALPFRVEGDKVEVLLITSRGRKRWVIPKGVRELDLDSAASAAKEAFEEAGIEGELSDRPIGLYRYEKWGGVCTVEVFSLAVRSCHASWPESYRDRVWLRAEEAAKRVDEIDLKRIILEFAASVDIG